MKDGRMKVGVQNMENVRWNRKDFEQKVEN